MLALPPYYQYTQHFVITDWIKNYKVRDLGSLQWYNFHAIFNKNRNSVFKVRTQTIAIFFLKKGNKAIRGKDRESLNKNTEIIALPWIMALNNNRQLQTDTRNENISSVFTGEYRGVASLEADNFFTTIYSSSYLIPWDKYVVHPVSLNTLGITCTVLDSSGSGTWGINPTQGMDMRVRIVTIFSCPALRRVCAFQEVLQNRTAKR